MDVKLVAMAGERPGREISVDVDEFVIGRSPSCQYQIHADQISHRHCRILKKSGRVLVEDLRSTNGTLVNDRLIQIVELEDGDRLRVGPFCFRLAIPAGAAALEERAEDWIASALEPRPRPAMNLLDSNTDTPAVATAQQVLGRLLVREARQRSDRPAIRIAAAAQRTLVRTPLEGGITGVRVARPMLVQDADVRAFDEELNSLVASGHNRLVLDFVDVEFISSAAISRLVKYHKQCQAQGGLIRLCRLGPAVAQVYRVMNLNRLFEVYPDEASALASVWPPQESPTAPDLEVVPAGRPADPKGGISTSPPGPSAEPGSVRLIVLAGHAQGQAIAIRSARFTIGRDPSCQLRPNSALISRQHAVIERREGRVYVRDLGSKNGTWVNDRRLRADEEVEVGDADRFQVGSLPFRFAIGVGGDQHPKGPEAADPGWLLAGGDAGDGPATALFLQPPPAGPAPAPGRPEGPAPGPHPVEPRYLTHEVLRGVLVIGFRTPELDDEATVGPVRHELLMLLEQEAPRRVVLRLDAVKSLSSRAVGMLLANYQRLHRSGAQLRLCGVRPDVRRPLEHMRVPMLIAIDPDLDAALQASWE
ncbi:MAG TPA: FHA domain-containing protein [Isosphaeraceae bacterium]